MATYHSNDSRFGMAYLPSSITLRLGRREIFISRDCRRHYSPLKPLLHCNTGLEPGYLELLLLRKWLVVLSKAR